MLKVYATSWCPHCRRAVIFLKKHEIDFEYIDIEKQPDDVVRQVIDANGGIDWVVPTMEFNGQWRPGKKHSDAELESDLRNMGVIK